MEEDVEFRRGLPFACLQFMGYSKVLQPDKPNDQGSHGC